MAQGRLGQGERRSYQRAISSREDWIFLHDAEKHAEDSFDMSFQRVRQDEKGLNGHANGVGMDGVSAMTGRL